MLLDLKLPKLSGLDGSPSPLLKRNIGMAYVPVEIAVPGAAIQIEIRGQKAPAQIVPLPFYRRSKV